MKVRAIKVGYYDLRRRIPGGKYAEFELSDSKHFSANWMEKLDEEVKPEPKKAPVKKPGSKVI